MLANREVIKEAAGVGATSPFNRAGHQELCICAPTINATTWAHLELT
jgi:hypothetical protein